MGSFSIWHWLIVLAVVVLLFGGGQRLSAMMGDIGRGMRIFKRNLQDDPTKIEDPQAISHKSRDKDHKETL